MTTVATRKTPADQAKRLRDLERQFERRLRELERQVAEIDLALEEAEEALQFALDRGHVYLWCIAAVTRYAVPAANDAKLRREIIERLYPEEIVPGLGPTQAPLAHWWPPSQQLHNRRVRERYRRDGKEILLDRSKRLRQAARRRASVENEQAS